MAISISKFVDVSTRIPKAKAEGRRFDGLVFTASEMNETSDYKDAYDRGEVVRLQASEVLDAFGAGSPEDKFATGYYGYIGPNGELAGELSFAKVLVAEARVSDGSDEVGAAVKAFTRVTDSTNAFGSFTFLDSEAKAFTVDDLTPVAVMNSGMDTRYLFVVAEQRGDMTREEVCDSADTLKACRGTVYISAGWEVSAYMPMALLSATRFETGEVINYMFKQFASEPVTVTSDNDFEEFGKHNVNFYGRTQNNGMAIDFYMHGYNTDGTDTAVYCNEMWFKSACITKLMGELVGTNRLPANAYGISTVRSLVLDVISKAMANGTFSPKDVTQDDQRAIRQLLARMGDDDGTAAESAIDSLRTYGYYLWVALAKDDNGKPIIQYYVFYGTGDSIRFIKGDDVLVA